MVEILKIILTRFTDETIIISATCLFLVFSILIMYWLYNRSRFYRLRTQIPASVVKGYLDSLIQNSKSIKSSFVIDDEEEEKNEEEASASIVPLKELEKSGRDEGKAQRLNEVLDLKTKGKMETQVDDLNKQLADKDKVIRKLEDEAKDNLASIKELQQENARLKKSLEKMEKKTAVNASSAQRKSGKNKPAEAKKTGENKENRKWNIGKMLKDKKKEKSKLLMEFEKMLG